MGTSKIMMMTIMMDRVWCWLLYLERIQTMKHEHHSDWLHLITCEVLMLMILSSTRTEYWYMDCLPKSWCFCHNPESPSLRGLGRSLRAVAVSSDLKIESELGADAKRPTAGAAFAPLKHGKHGKLAFWSCLASWTSQCLVLGEFQCLGKSRIWPKQLEAER
jgi:hypothetical protein